MDRTYTTLTVIWFLLLATGCEENTPDEPEDPTPAEIALRWEYGTGTDLPLSLVPDELGRDALYVAAKTGGLRILGLGDAAPTPLATVSRSELAGLDAMHVVQDGTRLFVALGDFFAAAGSRAGLAVLDIADPASPSVLGTWATDEVVSGSAAVVVDGDTAYLGAMREGIYVLDVSDPGGITQIGGYLPDVDFPVENPTDIQHPNARGLALGDGLLYVCYDAGGLRVLDISDPAAPSEVGRYLNQGAIGKQQAYNSILLDGDRAFLAVDYCGFEIVDVSDPTAIVPLAWYNPWSCESPSNVWINSPGHASQLAFDAEAEIVWVSAGDSELLGIDVSTSSSPELLHSYGERQDGLGAWGVAWSGSDGEAVYLAYIRAILPFNGTWAGVKALTVAD